MSTDGFQHAACACRPPLTMCGMFDPEADAVEVLEDVDADGDVDGLPWCEPCLQMWEQYGCGNCQCGPGGLCILCRLAQQASTN